MSPEKRAKLEQKFLSQFPPDTTEAEKIVALETGLYQEYVNLVVINVAATDYPADEHDDDVVEYVPGVRKKNVERLMKQYAEKYPSAQIALYSTRQELPIYVYN